MMVPVVSFSDHDTSFHTEQTVSFVATVSVGPAHPISGNINSVASFNRIFSPPQNIRNGSRLNFGDGIGADLPINSKRNHDNSYAQK